MSFATLLFLVASGFTRRSALCASSIWRTGLLSARRLHRPDRDPPDGNFTLAIVAGGVAVAVLGLFIDRFLIRRVGENHLAQVLLTVGIAFVIGDVALWMWGGDNLKVPVPMFLRTAVELPGGMMYPSLRLMLVAFGVVVGIILWLLYHKTQFGAVVRAGVDDREMVSAIGINVDRLFIIVSALASFLAGMAGVVGGAFLTLYPGAEWEILVFALMVVIVGGLGCLEGAMVGALVVGLLDAFGRWLLPEFSYFVLFGPMALLLLFRPTGLYGKAH